MITAESAATAKANVASTFHEKKKKIMKSIDTHSRQIDTEGMEREIEMRGSLLKVETKKKLNADFVFDKNMM